MKNLTLLMVLATGLAYGQMGLEKNTNFLRQYKAPDFSQNSLGVSFKINGSDYDTYGTKKSAFRENSTLTYNYYSNSQQYQGKVVGRLNSMVNWSKSTDGEAANLRTTLFFRSENRFYFKPKWFVGVHGSLSTFHSFINVTGHKSYHDFDIELVPILSVGNGRLEPVEYARSAMDIERQLDKGQRLLNEYSGSELKIIADKLAEINNVRYFDFRLRRIEQLKALDETLKKIGGVSEFDITYFAHLADAYLYAKNFKRYSGFRQELGVFPFGGFYKLNYYLPKNYSVQHNFNAGTNGKLNTYISNNGIVTDFETKITGGYELGLYPTTRTNINFGAQIGSLLNTLDIGASLYGNGSVYFTPQFRLNFSLQLITGTDDVSNDFRFFNDGLNLYVNGYNFRGEIGLNYAIF